jgi:hypothetical protein
MEMKVYIIVLSLDGYPVTYPVYGVYSTYEKAAEAVAKTVAKRYTCQIITEIVDDDMMTVDLSSDS